jgi:hypothetical protein
MWEERTMKRTLLAITYVALSCLLVQTAAAWMRGGGSYGGGGHWGAAAGGGHWAAGG